MFSLIRSSSGANAFITSSSSLSLIWSDGSFSSLCALSSPSLSSFSSIVLTVTMFGASYGSIKLRYSMIGSASLSWSTKNSFGCFVVSHISPVDGSSPDPCDWVLESEGCWFGFSRWSQIEISIFWIVIYIFCLFSNVFASGFEETLIKDNITFLVVAFFSHNFIG